MTTPVFPLAGTICVLSELWKEHQRFVRCVLIHDHPKKETLVAFVQGQLDSDGIQEIDEHLRTCAACCQTLLGMGDDTFVNRLKKSGSNPATTQTILQPPEVRCKIPPELENHPRYRILGELGGGGMGMVYRAEHRLMNRVVAIKIINGEFVKHPHAVDRFRREVQAAAKLSHPNIVTAHDAEQAGDLHLLVMEYVDGTDLASIVKQSGPFSVESACQYIIEAASGLQHAHQKRMVHRDIKPHNLMLTKDGHIQVLDFGLAGLIADSDPPESSISRNSQEFGAGHLSADQLTGFGAVMGTPDYMSPEQAVDAHSADIRADIYSLGCTFYFLLTGRPPFQGSSTVEKIRAHVESSPTPLHEVDPQIPEKLSAVAVKMMARDPANRFQTPEQVAVALTDFLGARQRGVRRLHLALLAGAASLLAAIALAIFYVKTDYGTLVIEAADENVSVAIGDSGIIIRDEQSGRKYRLVPGEQKVGRGNYTIDVFELPEGLQFSTTQFTLSRGDIRRIRVTLKTVANSPVQSEARMKQPIVSTGGAPDFKELPLVESELTEDEKTAVAAARQFLSLIDANNPSAAIDSMSDLARQMTNKKQFELMHRATVQQYGPLKRRVLRKAFAVLPIPGLPAGDYFTVQFRSDFEHQSGHWEFVMLDRDSDGTWKVNAHAIATQPPSLRPVPEDAPPDESH